MRKLSLSLLLLLTSAVGFAQVYGTEGYLIGTAVEIGINGGGGQEGSDINLGQPPTPIHFRSNSGNLFGFVADPTFSGWVNFDGDFFTPGSPENGWGLEIGGNNGTAKFSNNCTNYGADDILGAVGNYVDNAGCMSIDWSGAVASSGVDLSVDITYSLKQNDLFYTTSVTITNNGAAAVDSVYYYRNVDPDNNVELSGDYSTTNTIQDNPPSSCNMAHVTAEQTMPTASYLGFAAIGSEFRVCHGGFGNRDASDMWNGAPGAPLVVTPGAVSFADEAISLSYLIQTIPPGGSETFKFVVILNAAGANEAFADLFEIDYVGAVAGSQCTPVIDTTYVVPGASGATGSACSDSVLLEITGASVGDFTWTWSPTVGLSSSTGSAVWAFPTSSTTYTITGTSISGCYPAPIVKTIVVITAPVADPTLTPAGPFCPGDPAVNIVAADPGGDYSATCGTCIDAVTGLFDPSALAVGSYWIYYEFGAGSGCIVGDSIEVTVGGLFPPVIDPAGPFCDGPASIPMTSTTAGGTWSASCGACIDAAGNFDPSIPGIGSYDIYYAVGGGCGGNDTITIDVVNNLDASVTPVPLPLCDASPAVIMVGATPGGAWSATCPTCIDPVTGSFDPSVGAGVYTIYYTFVGACYAIDSTVITVVTGPDATITPAGPFCDYDPVQTLAAASGAGAWTATCGACLDAATGDFDPAAAGPGTHDITYTITGTCVSIGTESIYVDSIMIDNVVTVDPLCFGSCDGTITVSATNATGISVDNGLTFQPSGAFAAQCAGLYDVIAESAIGCRAATTATLTDPPELILSVSTVDAICAGNCDGTVSSIVNGGTVAAGYNYTWSGSIAAATDPNAINVCAGTYNLTVTDDNGCTADSTGFIVGELAPLDPGINVVTNELCFQSCDGQIEVTGTTGVLFTLAGGNGSTTNATGVFTGLCSGVYNITVQDINGCIATSMDELFTPAQVVADFSFGPQPTSFMESEITFTNLSTNATLYNWTFAPNASDSTSESDPVISFPDTEPGTYTACLTALNDNGCDSTVCKTVIIDPEFIVYAPNAFTPDGDGINDTWMPVLQGADPSAYEVMVFNRWGELVWSSESLNTAWDGMIKGSVNNIAKEDVYVWRIRAKDIMLNEKHDFKGHVTVLK
jgi:gliding motility-associated-like protein